VVLTSILHAAAATAALSIGSADSVPAAPAIDARLVMPAPDDTVRRRPRAIAYSDWYARRLAIHRYASYAMLPVFAGEYVYGRKLLNEKTDAFAGRGDGVSDTDRNVHQVFAGSVAALFGINTVTGLWNLYDSRHDPAGRKLRITHAVLLLGADAGFVATGLIAGRATEGGPADGRTHRNVALASMGVATVGTGMMWLLHH
jgi:hypothetical protein